MGMSDGINEKAQSIASFLAESLTDMRNKVIAEGVNPDEATNVMVKAASDTLAMTIVTVIANENGIDDSKVEEEAALYRKIHSIVSQTTLKIMKDNLKNARIIEFDDVSIVELKGEEDEDGPGQEK